MYVRKLARRGGKELPFGDKSTPGGAGARGGQTEIVGEAFTDTLLRRAELAGGTSHRLFERTGEVS